MQRFRQYNKGRRNNFGKGRRFNRSGPSIKNTSEVVRAIRAMQIAQPQLIEEKEYVNNFNFEDFDITPELKKNIAYKKYNKPTPIQDQAINPILEGKDVIGIANTGTGKTAAFLIPLIEKVLKNLNERIIIMVPTRELAVQINEELKAFCFGLRIYSALCVGGMPQGRQRSELRRYPNFVIGTPGRLKDFSESHVLYLNEFHTVVLDEADRMVDIGFIHDIKYFISMLPTDRQSLFFSATITPKVNDILINFVKNPVRISVRKSDSMKNIKQNIVEVYGKEDKVEKLHQLLIKEAFDKVIVFGRTKWGMQKLSDELIDRGFKADVIHGNKSQNQRIRTLEKFKRNEIKVLLATDVASRGLDIPNVSHVINFDVPESYEDYVHRIGRTGRAEKTGEAITFVESK